MGGGGVNLAQQEGHRIALSVLGHAGRRQRGVMRPDRAVVIAHRIEARLTLRQSPHAPAGAELGRQQPARHLVRPRRQRQAGEQEMPGVGTDGAARLAVSVERDGVEALVLHPEALLHQSLHGLGALPPLRGARVAQVFAELAHRLPGGVGVALHLQKRDRALGETAVGVADGVLRILPALVGQTRVGAALIVDQAVAVAVAVVAHPVGGGDQVRPQPADQGVVAGAADVGAGQGDEQAGGVDPAVVEAERHLAQCAHLAAARLVHDLAGLAVLEGAGLGRLAHGQIGQDPFGQRRVEPQHLPGRDDAVASERRREPGRARVRVRARRQIGGQQGDVGARLVQPVVEPGAARAANGGAAPPLGPHRQPRLDRVQPPAAAVRRLAGVHAAFDEQIQFLAFGQAEHELRAGPGQAGGRLGEGQAAAPLHPVQTLVAEGDAAPVGGRGLDRAALGSGRAADLEDVGEIGREVERQRQQHVLHAVVDHADALEHPPLPQKAPTLDVQHARRSRASAHRRQRAVGGVAREEDVVLRDARTQLGRAG